jgi:hypothetical protein
MLRRTFLSSLFVAPVVQKPAAFPKPCPICHGTTFEGLGHLVRGRLVDGTSTGLRETKVDPDRLVERCLTCNYLRISAP